MLRSKIRVPPDKGLPRRRLDDAVATLQRHRFGLVVAPAGFGKTTLLAHLAATTREPVAWYRAEPADAPEVAVVAHLERALTEAVSGLAGGWHDGDDLVAALDDWDGLGIVLVVDDLHLLWGTDGESVLERLVHNLPVGISVLAASRRAPSFDLSRLRVSGEVLEIGPGDLRFRSWEVEELFRDFYGERLPPEEIAELARRTGGWAAGLQLFHLATRGKPARERLQLLHELAGRWPAMREYLARNMLDEIDQETRGFLLDTCVLDRLTAPMCNELRGRQDSHTVLAELEQRRIFTHVLDDEGGYRYHQVLRTHLEMALVEQLGEVEARGRYRHAARLLERAGALPEALRAHCRAEDWEAVSRLLNGRGEQLIARGGGWMDALPPALVDQDPWLMLARARRHVATGRWEAALDAYARAAAGFGAGRPEETCRRERQALAAWFVPNAVPTADWTGLLRPASRRDPAAAADRAISIGGPSAMLAAGLASLLAGSLHDARQRLAQVVAAPEATSMIALVAALGTAVADSLGGAEVDLAAVHERAEEQRLPWVATIARAALALDPSSAGPSAPTDAMDDSWGSALSALFSGLGELRRGGDPVEVLTSAANGFSRLGADVLEAWARSGLALALARRRSPHALLAAAGAERLARSTGTIGAHAIAYAALAAAEPERAHAHVAAARAIAGSSGLSITGFLASPHSQSLEPPTVAAASEPSDHRSTSPTVTLHCFGCFRLAINGRPVDSSCIKPRHRSVLHMLAVHAGRPLHRELLIDAFWPDEQNTSAATRNLHVAISAIRQLLQPNGKRGCSSLIARVGDTYRLTIGDRDDVDVLAFEQAIEAGRTALAANDAARAGQLFSHALAAYTGELLPDEGPVDWVVKERDRYHLAAAEAALSLAEIHLIHEQPRPAVRAAERGLLIDRYNDGLWRLLIRAHHQAGDRAGAQRACEGYDGMLIELGLPTANL